MDFSDATKIVFGRIQAVEPDTVSKIVGYLLLKDYGERDMIRLAFGPDTAIHSLVREAKTVLPGLALTQKSTCRKPCQYFFKGHCKHGSSCRFLHGEYRMNGPAHEAHFLLEDELVDLVKARGGRPVSVAALPSLYFERFGKALGCLEDGSSLTNLIGRFGRLRILDRPNGQHSVVLAEDAARLSEQPTVSQQIYLTFPADSEFSEEDVSYYFKQFGPVRDARIPSQQKRMFGFVTFEKEETAQFVLARGNPHFVNGARVLVKPYKEKSKHGDRKLAEKMEQKPMNHGMDSIPQFCDSSKNLKNQWLEEQMLELRNLRLSELRILKQMANFGESAEDVRLKTRLDQTNCGFLGKEDSVGLSLPDSPFASASTANSFSKGI